MTPQQPLPEGDPFIIAQNVLRLRKAKGVTQGQLAKDAGLTRQALGALERGETAPRFSTLQRVSAALSVPLVEIMRVEPTFQAIRFRAARSKFNNSAKRSQCQDILHRVARQAKDAASLEEVLGRNRKENTLRQQAGEEYKRHGDPKRLAEWIREMLKRNAPRPAEGMLFDVLAAAGLLGVAVLTFSSSLDGIFGFSYGEVDHGGPGIAVNIHEPISVERRVFTVAHELGHILMHLDGYAPQVEVAEENDAEERPANRFAGELLMPTADFTRIWNACPPMSFVDRVLRVKARFGVSYKTVLTRLVELTGQKNLYQRFNVAYARENPGRSLAGHAEPERRAGTPGLEENIYAESEREPGSVPDVVRVQAWFVSLVVDGVKEEVLAAEDGARMLGWRPERVEYLVRDARNPLTLEEPTA